MKKIVFLISLVFSGLVCANSSSAVDLTVSGSSTYVISANATYNLVTVQDNGTLVVNNGATLIVTGSLVGTGNASFLFDGATMYGRINIQSSKKIHLLNSSLYNYEAGPTDSILKSNSIIITSSTVLAAGPVAPYYTAGTTAKVELISPNDIYLSNANVTVAGGTGTSGYYGPKPDGSGTLTLQSTLQNVYVNNSLIGCKGYGSNLGVLSGNISYVFDSTISAVGTSGGTGALNVQGEEVNWKSNQLKGNGGNGLSVAIHGGTIYAPPTNGGTGSISITGKIVNLASNGLTVTGGAGGAGYSSLINPGAGGSATITINSTVNTTASLYSNTTSMTAGTGSSTGSTSLTITPSSINGALLSTVEVPRKVLEDFNDKNFWSPDSTMGWWDIDGTAVYTHSLIDYYYRASIKSMRIDFNKGASSWSLFGGYISAANANRNFTGFNTVRVWVRGDTDLLVKLRDRYYGAQDVSTQNMSASTEMTRLDFNFNNIISTYYKSPNFVDLTNVDNVLFFAAPGLSSTSGTFYIDSVELVNTLPIENFEDGNMWSPDTTLGWWDIDGTTVYTHSLVSSPHHEGATCMRVDYNKAGRAWSLFGGFISGSNSIRDFRAYRKLSFWFYGNTSLLVKLRDRTMHEQDVATVTGVAGQWTLVEVDFSDLTINKGDIDNILFFAAPGNSAATGTFYIDDLKLTK